MQDGIHELTVSHNLMFFGKLRVNKRSSIIGIDTVGGITTTGGTTTTVEFGTSLLLLDYNEFGLLLMESDAYWIGLQRI